MESPSQLCDQAQSLADLEVSSADKQRQPPARASFLASRPQSHKGVWEPRMAGRTPAAGSRPKPRPRLQTAPAAGTHADTMEEQVSFHR